jgi:Ni,Fe-hydrogenase III component G
VTATCLDGDGVLELYYHFSDGAHLSHLHLVVPKGTIVPSISGIYLCAFLVENEISELFGLTITGMAIDYKGRLLLNEDGPVTPMLKRPQATQDTTHG